MSTVNPEEIKNFESQSQHWWDETGPFKPLHQINPHRIQFIKSEICDHFSKDPSTPSPLQSLSILDVGCGGGLVCEPLKRLGGDITGIDAGEQNISVASAHAKDMGLDIHYSHQTAEDLVESGQQFDVVLALEIVEHVQDVPLFLASLERLVKPGGLLIMSTLNRTLKSFALGIVAAEYVLRWVPKGTHQWKQFVEPAELTFHLEDLGFEPKSIKGLTYNPLKKGWSLSRDTDVNYFLSAQKSQNKSTNAKE